MGKHLGFTGTRQGSSPTQREALEYLMADLWLEDFRYFHHGDCVGADAEAHLIAQDLEYEIIIHPPVDEKYRAFCKPFYEMRKAKPYIARNHDIVDESEFLIVVPGTTREVLRSGTWATKRYADKIKRVKKEILWP